MQQVKSIGDEQRSIAVYNVSVKHIEIIIIINLEDMI